MPLNILLPHVRRNVLPDGFLNAPELGQVAVITEPGHRQRYDSGVDVQLVDSIGDLDQVRRATMRVLATRDLHRVLAPFELSVPVAGYLRSYFGLPGPGFEQAGLFSVGAVLAAPLIAAGSVTAFGAIMFGDVLSFVIVAVALARLKLTRAAGIRPHAAGLVSDWRYASLAAVNGVLTMHMTILAFGLPLWLLRATSAPASLVAGLMLINTIMAVVLQVPFSKHATTTAGATRTLRLAGLMLAGCSVAMAAAAHTPAWLAVTLLVLATMLLSLGEIWQAAGAWELSYRYADPAREVQYLAVFSLGGSAQDVAGPVLVTGVVIAAGPAGWIGLAVVFAVEFLNAPHPELGRSGPVCPCTKASMDQNSFLLASADWNGIESTIEAYRQWFGDLLDHTLRLLTILVVLPGLDRTDPAPLDELQARLKDSFVAEGLMMVSSDLPFLLGSSGHLTAYLHRFAPGIPGQAQRMLVTRASL
jgi:hypothetical protein